MKRFEINNENYCLENVLVMRYAPKIKKCIIKKRVKSSFLYIEQGVYRYTSNSSTFEAGCGDIIYLPQSSCYTYEIMSDDAFCTQAEFNLLCNKSPVMFSDCPVLIQNSDAKILFNQISGTYFRNKFMTLSVLYKMISIISDCTESTSEISHAIRIIKPAVTYIHENFYKPVYIHQLAELCNISTVHMNRLFNEALGMSPIKYKNTLLMRYACKLLKSGEMNVSETADVLGYPDVYTFSQAFKKHIGISPKNYIFSRDE